MPRPSRAFVAASLLVVLALAVACVVLARREWFYGDDFLFLRGAQGERDWVHTFLPLGERAWWSYRPLAIELYFSTFFALAGLNAFPYLLASLVLHFASGAVVYRIARQLDFDPRVAVFVGAASVAMYPSLEGSLFWASGFQTVAGCFFYVLCVALFVEYRLRDDRRFQATSFAAFLATLLSNELGMTLPGPLLLLAFHVAQGSIGARLRTALRTSLPHLLLLFAYLPFRYLLIGPSRLPMPDGYYLPHLGWHVLSNVGGFLLLLFQAAPAAVWAGVAVVVAGSFLAIVRSELGRLASLSLVLGGRLLATMVPFVGTWFIHARAAMPMEAPFCLLIGAYLDALARSLVPRRARLVEVALVSALLAVIPYQALRVQAAHPNGAVNRDLIDFLDREHPGLDGNACVELVDSGDRPLGSGDYFDLGFRTAGLFEVVSPGRRLAVPRGPDEPEPSSGPCAEKVRVEILADAEAPRPTFSLREWTPRSPVVAVDFRTQVEPILRSRCYECHGSTERKGDLRLTNRADAFAPAESGIPVIVAGDAELSALYELVSSSDPEERMPKDHDPLTPEEIALLARWIDEGAEWPDEAPSHWAYRPPLRPPLPEVKDRAWPRNAIDRFVLARLERAGISPAAEADAPTLVRRLWLDLVGLPPPPEEVEAFVADPSPERWDAMVDRLLASPGFGERWASSWLDLARYADSTGFMSEVMLSNWPYRDWVIDAINSDIPFDRFAVEQLAGDLLPNATSSQKIATGFLRAAPLNLEAGVDEEDARITQVFDRVNTLGAALLGTTIECAQCHDHKYDPFTQRDYYRLLAFFDGTTKETAASNRDGVALRPWGPTLELPAFPETVARGRDVAERFLDEVDAALREALPGAAPLTTRERSLVLEQAGAGRFDGIRPRMAAIVQDRLATALGEDWWKPWAGEIRAKLLGGEPRWDVLRVRRFEGSAHEGHRALADGSILVEGEVPQTSTYDVLAESASPLVTGFRIEALADPRLPGGGPGRGDPVLPEFTLSAIEIAVVDGATETPLALAWTNASDTPHSGGARAPDGDRPLRPAEHRLLGRVRPRQRERRPAGVRVARLDSRAAGERPFELGLRLPADPLPGSGVPRSGLARPLPRRPAGRLTRGPTRCGRRPREDRRGRGGALAGARDRGREPAAIQEMYGTSLGRNAFANQCLLARRLIERGVRFVQIFDNGWDHHTSLRAFLPGKCNRIDRPAAALVRDLAQRGLLEDTLVIWASEFGRTPMAQSKDQSGAGVAAGRDHQRDAFTLWLGGGGVKAGHVHGRTDDLGHTAVEDPVHVHDLNATVLALLGVDHERLVYRHQGRDFRLTDVHGKVVRDIMA